MEKINKGPFTVKDGKIEDIEFFKEIMDNELQTKFDDHIFKKEVNKAAKAEKARRKVNESIDSLMESFGNY